MQLILNNPYRIVGLLVGATLREQTKQINKLKMFIEAEQEPSQDYSFPVLGNLSRKIGDINNASSKLNLDSDKISAALFWFWKGNRIVDEPALDDLKGANLAEALSIWTKYVEKKEVNQKNASAFFNLGTLCLSETIGLFESGVQLKLKFLESDYVEAFIKQATDEIFKITKGELQLLFLNQLQAEIKKSNSLTLDQLVKIVSALRFTAKEEFFKGFAGKYIEQIERLVSETQTKRKAENSKGLILGKSLFQSGKTILEQLKSVLGSSDIKYISASDKVAAEILQCGIDYFKHYRDSNTDPGQSAMDLFRKAKTLAIGSVVKQRIEENIENLHEWIEEKPERDKYKRIEDDLKFITEKLNPSSGNTGESENSFDKSETPVDPLLQKLQLMRFHLSTFDSGLSSTLKDKGRRIKELINTCKPRLTNIRNILGSSDDLYLKVSSAVVSKAQGELVDIINQAQKGIMKRQEIPLEFGSPQNSIERRERTLSLVEFTEIIRSAYFVITSIQTMDMAYDLKQQLQKNKAVLEKICNSFQIDIRTTPKELLIQEQKKMAKIKEWQFLRSETEKENQIRDQQMVINKLTEKLEKDEF